VKEGKGLPVKSSPRITAEPFARKANEMGADIQLFTHCLGSVPCRFKSHNYCHSIVVKGPTPLISKDITIPDLRAGFAYVLAALMAPDTSNISGAHFLDRGYENLVDKLASLGADISRELLPAKKLVAVV